MAKLYLRTLKVCSLIFVLCAFASIMLVVSPCNSPICTLLENYAIGIACSSLLVIIPVVLQYFSEMKRIHKEIESSAFYLVFNLSMGLYDKLNIRQYQYIWSLLEENFQKISTCQNELAYFTKKQAQRHFKEYEDILNDFLFGFKTIQYTDGKNIIDYLTNYDRFMKLANAALLIIKSDWERKHIQKLIQMAKNEKERINHLEGSEEATP